MAPMLDLRGFIRTSVYESVRSRSATRSSTSAENALASTWCAATESRECLRRVSSPKGFTGLNGREYRRIARSSTAVTFTPTSTTWHVKLNRATLFVGASSDCWSGDDPDPAAALSGVRIDRDLARGCAACVGAGSLAWGRTWSACSSHATRSAWSSFNPM